MSLFLRLSAALNFRSRTWDQFCGRTQWHAAELHRMGVTALALVKENLRRHVDEKPFTNPDDIFAPFTSLVALSLNAGLPVLASRYWPELDTVINEAEARLRTNTGGATARIHKGSPYYNVALCHFVAGDLESAFKFLSRTGDEHAISGGDPFPVVLGDHPLSRQFLIAPLVTELVPVWSARYLEVTGRTLDESQLIDLIKRAAKRPTDGIQFLLSLHRLLKSRGPLQNDWTRYLRTRALAETLVALESMLRRILAPFSGEMQGQFEQMFSGKAAYSGPFVNFGNTFVANFKPPGGPDNRRTPAAVDWSVNEAIGRIAAASTREAKAANACYASLRLRNTLLHVLESSLQIYSDEAKCLDMFALAVAAFRVGLDAEDGVL